MRPSSARTDASSIAGTAWLPSSNSGIDAGARRAHNETMKLALTAALAAALLVPAAVAAAPPQVAGCQVFPASSVWNKPVGSLPKAQALGQDRQGDRRGQVPARGLRLGRVGRRADRDPDHGRRRLPADLLRRLPLRRRKRSRPLPDPVRRRDRRRARCRRRPARDHRRARFLHALRALQPAADAVAGGLRGDLGPRLERAPAARLDVGGRRGAPDPAGARALRGGGERRDQARAPLHGRALAASVHLPRAPLRLELHESQPPAHGAAPAPPLRLPGRRLPLPGAGDPPRPEALRDDRGRQRLELVRLRAPRTSTGTTTSCTSSTA